MVLLILNMLLCNAVVAEQTVDVDDKRYVASICSAADELLLLLLLLLLATGVVNSIDETSSD